jgi:hypothetical protein
MASPFVRSSCCKENFIQFRMVSHNERPVGKKKGAQDQPISPVIVPQDQSTSNGQDEQEAEYNDDQPTYDLNNVECTVPSIFLSWQIGSVDFFVSIRFLAGSGLSCYFERGGSYSAISQNKSRPLISCYFTKQIHFSLLVFLSCSVREFVKFFTFFFWSVIYCKSEIY